MAGGQVVEPSHIEGLAAGSILAHFRQFLESGSESGSLSETFAAVGSMKHAATFRCCGVNVDRPSVVWPFVVVVNPKMQTQPPKLIATTMAGRAVLGVAFVLLGGRKTKVQ